VQKLLDSASRMDKLLLMAPAVMDSARADALLQSAKHAVVLIPGIDEDGRSVFWEEAAEDVAHVTLRTLDGVGVRVDWAWEEILEIAELLFGETPPQSKKAAAPVSEDWKLDTGRGLRTSESQPASHCVFDFSKDSGIDDSESSFKFHIGNRSKTLNIECALRHTSCRVRHLILRAPGAGSPKNAGHNGPLFILVSNA